MNNFKYRGWSEGVKRMTYFGDGTAIITDTELKDGEAWGLFIKTDGPIYLSGYQCDMQFTGLLDKKSKDIYHKDILGRWEDEQWIIFGIVEYCGKSGCIFSGSWYLADKNGYATDWAYEDDGRPENWHNLEVIGNVFENPDLADGLGKPETEAIS